jgi:transposase
MRCTKTRGKKGTPHPDPEDPPRRRGNKVKGHGCWDNDRVPILGVLERSSGLLSLKVLHSSGAREVHPEMLQRTAPGTVVNTDEWHAYDWLPRDGRSRRMVRHKDDVGRHEWARDDDGDGIREVHCNSSEGLWTGLRNFLRPFRGVHKQYLAQYVAVFEHSHNLKTATREFIAAFLGVRRLEAA